MSSRSGRWSRVGRTRRQAGDRSPRSSRACERAFQHLADLLADQLPCRGARLLVVAHREGAAPADLVVQLHAAHRRGRRRSPPTRRIRRSPPRFRIPPSLPPWGSAKVFRLCRLPTVGARPVRATCRSSARPRPRCTSAATFRVALEACLRSRCTLLLRAVDAEADLAERSTIVAWSKCGDEPGARGPRRVSRAAAPCHTLLYRDGSEVARQGGRPCGTQRSVSACARASRRWSRKTSRSPSSQGTATASRCDEPASRSQWHVPIRGHGRARRPRGRAARSIGGGAQDR